MCKSNANVISRISFGAIIRSVWWTTVFHFNLSKFELIFVCVKWFFVRYKCYLNNNYYCIKSVLLFPSHHKHDMQKFKMAMFAPQIKVFTFWKWNLHACSQSALESNTGRHDTLASLFGYISVTFPYLICCFILFDIDLLVGMRIFCFCKFSK